MSYGRQSSTTRLMQYRARQADHIEAMIRAIDNGRATIVPSAVSAEESPTCRVWFTAELPVKQLPAIPIVNDFEIKRYNNGVWVGCNKSVTASLIETSLRQPIHITVAAPIRQDGSQSVLKNVQLFSYNAELGQMIQLDKQRSIITHIRRAKSRVKYLKGK